MLIIRPIGESDYDALLQCAQGAGHGFTSLPVEPSLLRQKIQHSVASFAANAQSPGHESYLMVAEDTQTGEIAGTTGMKAAIGLETPFYSYHVSQVVHYSKHLNVHNIVEVLTLSNDYTGMTEICSLFLRPSFRGGLNGKLLSKSRFLMLAEFPEKFSSRIFAEMRGVSDANGHSPFWAWLKAHFFSIDFMLADYLTGIGQKAFIAELMPKLPIYVNLLSDEARAVIGQVHQETLPALKLLEQEGFCSSGYIDIFDAGATVECGREQIDSVRRSFNLTVTVSDHHSATPYLVSNTHFENFRATIANIGVDMASNTALLAQDVADALQIKTGDRIRLSPL